MSNKKEEVLDIARNKIAGECDMKCSYNFAYSSSSVSGFKDANNGSLTLNYDKTNVPPVKYNGNNYRVANVQMIINPLYKIQGRFQHIIFMITHAPVVEGPPLYVLIPIIRGNTNSAGKILSDILNGTNKIAPKGGKFSLNTQFNLQDIVPNNPFYSVSGGLGDIIMYDREHAMIMEYDTYKAYITSMWAKKYNAERRGMEIWENSTKISSVPYFYNPLGPNSSSSGRGGAGSDDVYIDCKPVNVDEEKAQVKMEKYNTQGYSNYIPTRKNMLRLFKSPVFQGLLVLLFVIIIYQLVKMALKYGKPTQNMGD